MDGILGKSSPGTVANVGLKYDDDFSGFQKAPTGDKRFDGFGRMKELREMRNYSQRVLAERAGMIDVQIQKYEYGMKPKPEQIKRIAQALDVDIAFLQPSLTSTLPPALKAPENKPAKPSITRTRRFPKTPKASLYAFHLGNAYRSL